MAKRINVEHDEWAVAFETAAERAARCGTLLLEAKRLVDEKLGWGHWERWVRENCPQIGDRTRRLFMQWAKSPLEKRQRVAALGLNKGARALSLDLTIIDPNPPARTAGHVTVQQTKQRSRRALLLVQSANTDLQPANDTYDTRHERLQHLKKWASLRKRYIARAQLKLNDVEAEITKIEADLAKDPEWNADKRGKGP